MPEGYLLFCDIPAAQIVRLDSKGKSIYRSNSGGAAALALDHAGRMYVAETKSRRVTRTDKKGKLEIIAETFEGKKLNGPNDLTISRTGHVYFTDPAFGPQDDARQLPYAIYHVPPKGDMERLAVWRTRPNGIAISNDGKTLYVANSDERSIHVFTLGKDGTAGESRPFITGIAGPPDGIKVDEKGNVFVAANGLAVYSPSGKLLHTFEMADKPSNCALGDGDMQTLYVTARTNVYRIRFGSKSGEAH